MLKPRYVTKHLQANIKTQLREKVEGKVTQRYGFTIAVTKIINIGNGGIIDVEDASVHFKVTFECLVFRPFKGDILVGAVGNISHEGMYVFCGPLQVFVHKSNIASGRLVYDDTEPSLPKYVSPELVIGLNDKVRVKIISDKTANDNPICIGEIIKQQD